MVTMQDKSLINTKMAEADFFRTLRTRAENTDHTLLYIGSLLQRGANLYGDRLALVDTNRSISYTALYAKAVALSKKLLLRGVQPRDRVLLFFENSIEFYIGYFAVVQIGAVIAPLNTFLHDRELQHIIADAQPKLMIASDACVARLKNIGFETLALVTKADMEDEGNSIAVVDDFTVTQLGSDEMVALLYTSGTTGLPKGVMLSSKNIMTNVLQGVARVRFGLGKQERMFGVLPLFHSFAQFACLWGSFFMGAMVILVAKIDRKLILNALKHRPTIFLGVPALYGLLCLMKSAPIDSVDYFISGGDALSDKIRAAFSLIYRRKICSGYGLTETSPLLAVDLADKCAPTSMVGQLVHGVQALVKDSNGNPLGKNEIGQLWVKGDNVMLGYYNEPVMTDAVLQDGWFDTGDLVYLDDHNNVVITGRVKDLIIHKGFNIYPQEIENIIVGHSAVLRAAVIGKKINDEEVPVAYVQLKEAAGNIEAILKNVCQKNLAHYKVPRIFYCTTHELPLTATGKINKKKLQQQEDEKSDG